MQDGEELEPSPRQACWYLARVGGEVVLRCTDYGEITLNVDRWLYRNLPVLVFQGWEGYHKPLPAVRKSGRRKVLVVVPDCWRFGDPQPAPEPLGRPAGYQAYCLDLAERSFFYFRDGEGAVVRVNLGGRSHFELVGSVLPIDRDNEQGPIFIGEPPVLRCLEAETLDEVGWVEVLPGGHVLQPSSEWLSRGAAIGVREPSGCFEVVVYGRDQLEMERLPFRFAAYLSGVEILPDPLGVFPEVGGHPKVRIRFLAQPGCRVELKTADPRTGVVPPVTGGEVCLPPAPTWDCTLWEVCCEGGRPVPVEVTLQRVWWVLGRCGEVPDQWTDQIVEFDLSWLQATSDKAIWLRCPLSAVLHEVRAGFEDDWRSYRLNKVGLVEIPLRNYCDTIAAPTADQRAFKVWLCGRDGAEAIGRIGVYRQPASASPEDDCYFCSREKEGLLPEEQSRCCATCSFCRTHRRNYFCISGGWKETRLSERDFVRLRASNVCSQWLGEYPGQPFEWEAMRLIDARVCIPVSLPEHGFASKVRGVVVGVAGGKIRVHWDWSSEPGVPETWLCKFHFDKYCREERLR
ncbi:MAG: hypothetical protein PWP58_524 [Bacillota bacterium]|jgi:hypothetical protein|nr:hypothetical protein [Bacillota bacterium]